MIVRVGQRIELLDMPEDPDPIPTGARGTVTAVHGSAYGSTQITVDWDNGRSLMLAVPPDKFRVVWQCCCGYPELVGYHSPDKCEFP